METLDKSRLPEKNKEQLLADQERLKAEMEYQLVGIKEDAADVGKTMLMVGGGIYLSYKLIRYIVRNRRKKKDDFWADGSRPVVINKKEKVSPTFGSLLTQQLLTIAVLVVANRISGMRKDHKILNE